MSYITTSEFDRILTLPISLPQTELRRQRFIQLAALPVAMGQRLEIRGLTIHLVKILTPGVTPTLDNASLGLCSSGILVDSMATSAVGCVFINGLGAACMSSDQPVIITAPGNYRVLAFNNANNVDLSVAVTGSAKFYL